MNTVLYFPERRRLSAAGLPGLDAGDPRWSTLHYAVHAFKSLLLKNTGFGAIGYDLLFLALFSAVAMTLATRLFKRTL